MVCKETPVDIALVIDSTASIHSYDNFQLGLQFLRMFLEPFKISPTSVRVAAVMFGYGVYTDSAFNFDTYANKEETLNAISNLPWMGGNTTETFKVRNRLHERTRNPREKFEFDRLEGKPILNCSKLSWRHLQGIKPKIVIPDGKVVDGLMLLQNILLLSIMIRHLPPSDYLSKNERKWEPLNEYNNSAYIHDPCARPTCVDNFRWSLQQNGKLKKIQDRESTYA
ncbi:hypothetical protein Btru_053857 [Bulinus truncatus]|nr:hypothetical protein Btru_053857 [Bulinus truncatus]